MRRCLPGRRFGRTRRHTIAVRRAVASLAVLLFASTAGCGALGRACTEIGCSDSLSVRIAVDGDGVISGVTTINLVVEGAPSSCQLSADQLNQVMPCDFQTSASLRRAFTCTSMRNADGSETESCESTDGFEVHLSLSGTPAELSVELVDDAGTATRFDLQPKYEKYFPNGKRCEPVCRTAQIELGPLQLQLGDGEGDTTGSGD